MFIPGVQLSERFYWDAVRPILDHSWPDLRHSAALIGSGSEVLGFDDELSTDHHWGPRVMLFLTPADDADLREEIHNRLAAALPYEFMGYSTNFTAPNPDDNNTQLPATIHSGPINHRVEIGTLHDYVRDYLGWEMDQDLSVADWLTFPQQKLRTLTAGALFHDAVGLAAFRRRLDYYPHDLWLYLLAAGWARIGQEEHLMGRAGLAGDELGSRLIGARLVRDIMRLGFLMERTYAPYPKWFGSAFRALACAAALTPHLDDALAAATWEARGRHLALAYEELGRMHNSLGLTSPMPEQARFFFGRPFQVMALHGFTAALTAAIQDPAVQKLAARPLIGNIDLVSDNTDVLGNPSRRATLSRLYSP